MGSAPQSHQTSVLIVGAGLAGLFLALRLSPRPVIVVSPAPLGQGSASAWAQGGLAAALDPEDSPAAHAADTVAAGAGLVDPVVAMLLATEGPARVRDLIALGVPFDRTPDGALALSLEAAHSKPRVARVKGDLAGRAIMQALIEAARNAPHIEILEGMAMGALRATSSGRVVGAAMQAGGQRLDLQADETILATGGVGGLFAVTTNPASAQGDGLAAAYTVGALLSDLEFVQFHPTALDIGADPAPLATEALRGEGATLINADGTPFMARYHADAELAPRDVVARAIHTERAAGRGAFLDATQAIGQAFPDHFPTVYASCLAAGIDPCTAPIPIAPAAHYHMGGIVTDLWGKTTVNGLSALGECASTGAHGANRLASNSLLEAIVFADRIARRLKEDPSPAIGTGDTALPPALPKEALQALRSTMSAQCGVVRNAKGLLAAETQIAEAIATHGQALALIAAREMVEGAIARKESRGGHYREDYPHTENNAERAFRSTQPAGVIP